MSFAAPRQYEILHEVSKKEDAFSEKETDAYKSKLKAYYDAAINEFHAFKASEIKAYSALKNLAALLALIQDNEDFLRMACEFFIDEADGFRFRALTEAVSSTDLMFYRVDMNLLPLLPKGIAYNKDSGELYKLFKRHEESARLKNAIQSANLADIPTVDEIDLILKHDRALTDEERESIRSGSHKMLVEHIMTVIESKTWWVLAGLSVCTVGIALFFKGKIKDWCFKRYKAEYCSKYNMSLEREPLITKGSGAKVMTLLASKADSAATMQATKQTWHVNNCAFMYTLSIDALRGMAVDAANAPLYTGQGRPGVTRVAGGNGAVLELVAPVAQSVSL